MLALFYIFIGVAIGVSFWQITRILNLRGVIATDKDNDRQGKYFILFGIFIYALMIYCLIGMNVLMLPASYEGENDDLLFDISFWMIGIVQFIMQFIIFFFTYKYRGKKTNKAKFYADNHMLELIWTIIPGVVIIVLIGFGIFQWTEVMYVDESEDPIQIEVYAKQFAWQARYAGADNTLGLGNVNFIDETNNPIGVDMSDPASLDDIPVTELHLPKGKKVLFKFRSQDVLHSAYMPHFRAQMNCVPGMVTQFAFTPKYTTEEMREQSEVMDKTRGINKIRSKKGEDLYEFDYVLLCNKICGASHYSMQMKIIVEEEEDYKKWLAEQATYAEKL
jgi:cytochrome c oxidase subunit 2